MQTQSSTPKAETSEMKQRLSNLTRAFEGLVDRAQPASAWSREMLARAERNAAKGLWNAAAQLDRAAKRLDAAGRQLEKPATNGKHHKGSGNPSGLDEEAISPHLA